MPISGPGLGYDSQRRQRYQFLLMVALSSTVFGAFNFRGLAVVSGIWKGKTVKDGQRAWVKNWFPYIFDMTKVKRKHVAKNGYWMDGNFSEWASQNLCPQVFDRRAISNLQLFPFTRGMLGLGFIGLHPPSLVTYLGCQSHQSNPRVFSPGTKKKPKVLKVRWVGFGQQWKLSWSLYSWLFWLLWLEKLPRVLDAKVEKTFGNGSKLVGWLSLLVFS